MKSGLKVFVFSAVLLLALGGGEAAADKFDILMEKLVERGVISPSDAEEIEKEVDAEDARQKEAATKKVATGDAMVPTEDGWVKLPGWVQNLDFSGDLRLRYQTEDRDDDDRDRRNRGRFRLRAGVEAQITDQWKAGFGIASGGDDPRSTNETLDNTFESPDLRIDYAFAQYQPMDWVKIVGGKIKNPIWRPKDLLWDSDIRPEGAAVLFDWGVAENVELFATPAFFILDEFSEDSADPFMALVQFGGKADFAEIFDVKLAGTYYHFDNVEGNSFDDAGASAESNTRDGDGNLAFGYNALGFGAEAGVKLPIEVVPYAGIFGEYVVNIDDDDEVNGLDNDDDQGYLIGAKFGHKKVGKFGQWQARYNYRRLETDAWPDFLPDSDFFGGATNAKGHEIEFAFGLTENVTMALDYYHSEPIDDIGDSDIEEDLFQVDLVLKW